MEQARDEMLNFRGAGMGIMEMSHRSKEFVNVHTEAVKDLRDIMDIPEEYAVMFLQGGATGQFASVPLNLLGEKSTADYVVTGQWSEKAHKECAKYGNPNKVVDMKPTKYTTVKPQSEWQMDPNAAYLHYCLNETVNGVEMKNIPNVDVPLVSDMSSNFISRDIHVRKHAAIYAGAQKNAGPAGATIVIVRKDLLGVNESKICPTAMSWKTFADTDSMYNTPPCYSMYMMGLYFKYTKSKGGLQYWDELADKKSGMLYDAIDNSDGFYTGPVDKEYRSRMNVPFQIQGGNEALEKKFMEEAKKVKLFTLAGHRSVGGLRASLYNGMPVEGVQALTDFMSEFKSDNL